MSKLENTRPRWPRRGRCRPRPWCRRRCRSRAWPPWPRARGRCPPPASWRGGGPRSRGRGWRDCRAGARGWCRCSPWCLHGSVALAGHRHVITICSAECRVLGWVTEYVLYCELVYLITSWRRRMMILPLPVEGGCNITTRYLVISTYILYKIVDCKRYYF